MGHLRPLLLLLATCCCLSIGQMVGMPQSFPGFGNGQQGFGQDQSGVHPYPHQPPPPVYSGSNHRVFSQYDGNLVPYGPTAGDLLITNNAKTSGQLIKLPGYFPFYGGRYNYTMISPNGFVSFAYFTDDGGTEFQVGPEQTDWPSEADPAVIAPYMCRQRIDSAYGTESYVGYRIEARQQQTSAYFDEDSSNRRACLGRPSYHRCDFQSDQFLDAMQRTLQEGVAGASTFRAEAALIVTWRNLLPNLGKEQGQSTYQLVWLTDAQGLLSYTIINYDRLGYDAADVQGNNRMGRCKALFNGGNHTGLVDVDLSEQTKHSPSTLATRSAVPHVVRGRYLHRVDDVVRPAGCSNKTGGTFPLLVYPNIVTMLGETTVEVNGLCLNPSITYVLMIEQREAAPCEILNPSIARCTLPKVLDWGTKTVYFQPQSGLANDEKAYIGYIYFVPPTIDPMRLDIGDLHRWFINPSLTSATLKWFPRNFTNHRTFSQNGQSLALDYSDPSIYSLTLGLYIVGYREAQDESKMKFVPQHRVLARVTTLPNSGDEQFRWAPQVASISLLHVDEWYITEWERKYDLYSYRFGYLKLAPLVPGKTSTYDKHTQHVDSLPDGMVSSPVPLHWLWPLAPNGQYKGPQDDQDKKTDFVRRKSQDMCKNWYEEDGALDNFIRETESNSSCPCRFMPHPRCSTLFRDVSCTETLGSMNCYMSAQNVQGSRTKKTQHGETHSNYNTHYGQVCCYDAAGYLMQSTYQPVLKIDDSTPYSPGFPTRSYEFGTTPYQGMFEIPGLSSFHHDVMPYYLCCKFADFRCQMFYWRRPSSACQAYEPPAVGLMSGAGLITTLNQQNLIFNDPGVYTLLHAHRTESTPEVQIQVRLERFPDRSVDFSGLNIQQQDLVQPTNVTVLTGIVLSADDTDKVHVILRKDTRRGRYRTSIIVSNVVRYFDTMHLQRFKGVTVYVNSVERGQPEIYVTLDAAQIGVRIRESYAIDVDRINHFESLGLLDLQVSVPPQYNVNPFHDHSRPRAKVEGLILPFPEQASDIYPDGATVQWSNVNSEGIRQKMLTYRIRGEYDFGNGPPVPAGGHNDVVDLFEARSDSEKLFEAYPDYYLKGPVYPMPTLFQAVPFIPQTEQQVRQFLDFCKRPFDRFHSSGAEARAHRRCPRDAIHLETQCNHDVNCIFDTLFLQDQKLGELSDSYLHTFVSERNTIVAHFNSCGAMNIEYPEYLIKGPSSADPAYLEGHKLSFSCYQTHIIKGDIEYTCSKQPLHSYERKGEFYDGSAEFRMQWTQGGQPWCRHRTKQNYLTAVAWVGAVLIVLIVAIIIFACFWSVKQKSRNERRDKQEASIAEIEKLDEKAVGARYEKYGDKVTMVSTPSEASQPIAPPRSYVKKPAGGSGPPSSVNSSITNRMRPSSSNPALANPRDSPQPPLYSSISAQGSPHNTIGRRSPSQLRPAIPGSTEIQV